MIDRGLNTLRRSPDMMSPTWHCLHLYHTSWTPRDTDHCLLSVIRPAIRACVHKDFLRRHYVVRRDYGASYIVLAVEIALKQRSVLESRLLEHIGHLDSGLRARLRVAPIRTEWIPTGHPALVWTPALPTQGGHGGPIVTHLIRSFLWASTRAVYASIQAIQSGYIDRFSTGLIFETLLYRALSTDEVYVTSLLRAHFGVSLASEGGRPQQSEPHDIGAYDHVARACWDQGGSRMPFPFNQYMSAARRTFRRLRVVLRAVGQTDPCQQTALGDPLGKLATDLVHMSANQLGLRMGEERYIDLVLARALATASRHATSHLFYT
jgi:hypothetical protein